MTELTGGQVAATAAWLESAQLDNGMVPWFAGGHADPWNHTEALMAMAVGGQWEAVVRGFDWLAANQLMDGSWCTFYLQDGVVEPRRDPNVCSYVATGALWCSLLPGGPGNALLEHVWPMVDRALSWCVAQQRPGGELAWSVGPDGVPGRFALLAACSSAQHSLLCGSGIAARLGRERPGWARAAQGVATAVRWAVGAAAARSGMTATPPGRVHLGGVVAADGASSGPRPVFAVKDRWAMDWYYPVLTGVLTGDEARTRMLERWGRFVEEGLGTRCVEDSFWVTAAETAECAMAAARAGMATQAAQLLDWVGHLREIDGSYWTGCAHPECVRYPGGQHSTYSAAAVVIADHVLWSRSAASALFAPVATRSGGAGARDGYLGAGDIGAGDIGDGEDRPAPVSGGGRAR